mmetsp:Transcript_69672/g.149054  ORF Transcript_69672/g.149054 Transcript_69672/m.149054 type:complete len:249 (+) Transcript_69672:3-749(+)
MGDCFIDSLIATEKLALASFQIEESVRTCDPVDTASAACAGDVTGIYASFAAAAGYLSGVASTCPIGPANSKAMCASDMADIQYGIGTLASALSTIAGTCRLGATEELKPIPLDSQVNDMGMCVINAAQAAGYIGHAVVSIRAAVHNCVKHTGSAKEISDDQAVCATDISDIVQSFLLIVAYLANAAALCGDTVIVGAACANRVASILAGFAEIAAGGSGAHVDCAHQPTRTHGNRGLDPDGTVRKAR